MQLNVLEIHQGDHRIQPQLIAQVFIDKERLNHRGRIRQAGGFDHQVIEAITPLHQVADDPNQIAAHRAADAAVVHLEDLLIGINYQLVVDAHLAELVDDHRHLEAVLVGEDPVEQGRLAGTEVTGEHGHWQTLGGGNGAGEGHGQAGSGPRVRMVVVLAKAAARIDPNGFRDFFSQAAAPAPAAPADGRRAQRPGTAPTLESNAAQHRPGNRLQGSQTTTASRISALPQAPQRRGRLCAGGSG